MSNFDELIEHPRTPKKIDEDEPIKSEAEKRGLTREQAIEYGEEMARLECVQLAKRQPNVYTPDVVKARIERAGEYAAWEYDGRQAGTIGRVAKVSSVPDSGSKPK